MVDIPVVISNEYWRNTAVKTLSNVSCSSDASWEWNSAFNCMFVDIEAEAVES